MIQFLKLVINNFFSWGESQIIPLYKLGVIHVGGRNLDEPGADSNMAGKSGILEALLWCLYGRTIRNVKHDSVVNRFHKNNCYVSVWFRKHHVQYRVSRYRKHKQHRNRLLLWRGDRILSYRHESDTQAKLESILGCDFQAFTHTTIFGGPRPFALLTDAEQKKILESFLHFEKFEIALRRTKDLLSEAVERSHSLELRTVKVRGDVQAIRGRLGSLSRAVEVGRKESQQERSEIKQRLKKLLLDKEGIRASSKSIQRELEEAGEEKEAQEASLTKTDSKRYHLRQRLKDLRKSLLDKRKLIGKPCPTCGRKVVSVEHSVRHTKKEIYRIKGELREFVGVVHAKERKVSYAREYLKRVQKKASSVSQLRVKTETQRRELKKSLQRLCTTETPFAEEISKLSFQYSKAASRLLVHQFEMQSLQRRIKDLEFWAQGFGNQGVKALIVREALPAMNAKLQEYSQEIHHGTAKIRFSPTKARKTGEERELFNLSYQSRFGSSSYVGESSGGRRRVDICVLLVFSWLSASSNLLIVDELLDGLDSTGREAVLSILSRLRGTVLVISHSQEMKAKFRNTWTVVKRRGISKIEKENFQ